VREEKKFGGVEELKAQIGNDVAVANSFFERLRTRGAVGTPD
jgi:FAD synthase